jgi:thiamine-phosphate pyrophosphorylase
LESSELSDRNSIRIKAFSGKYPHFYYVTDRRQLSGISLDRCIRRALDWGVRFIQIREKDLNDRALYELVCRIVRLAGKKRCRIIVNSRADIALAAGAHGVHLPAGGLPAGYIRDWVTKSFLVGASAHSLREARRAVEQGVDYLLLGPVFDTPSKRRYGPPLGLNVLRRVCARMPVPVFALGGIKSETIGPVLQAGACGVAAITLFQAGSAFRDLKKLDFKV